MKNKQTSRVIDSLHGEIDDLKTELENVKQTSEDYKKKCAILAKKNDLFVDQLANAKHENDMINALLKRKERRINDLESQYNDLSSNNESLQLTTKNLKIRCENLQECSASSTAEYERLKIAYDALIASQVEYKKHYQQEITSLVSQFEAYKADTKDHYTTLSSTLEKNDKDIDALLDGLANKRKTMDNLYVSKNKTVIEHLRRLAVVAKAHGEDSKQLLLENTDTIQKLIIKYPDLQLKLNEHEDCQVNLEELLGETTETAANISFEDDSTDSSKPSVTRTNTMTKRKRNNRNSIRFEQKNTSSDFESLDVQLQAQKLAHKPTPLQQSSRINSNTPRSRNPTPPYGGTLDTENKLTRQNSTKSTGKNNKGKRRSMYGAPRKSGSRQASDNLSEQSFNA